MAWIRLGGCCLVYSSILRSRRSQILGFRFLDYQIQEDTLQAVLLVKYRSLSCLDYAPSYTPLGAQKSCSVYTRCRGGVEDTRLEAKAKDTKKIRGQGQGQPFRGQTLSRPRTGMLEAKAKDQGHKAQVLSKKKKKKGLQKIFQALHKILTFQKIVLSSSRGQANIRRLEASRPRPRT